MVLGKIVDCFQQQQSYFRVDALLEQGDVAEHAEDGLELLVGESVDLLVLVDEGGTVEA